jgi:CelD/BcsL family acetyltransferase involved in cellulose biosynthesis
VTVRDGSCPVAILPTVAGNWLGISSIRFLGDPFAQYGDIIARPNAKVPHLEAALEAACDEGLASVAFFRKVRVDSAIAPILARSAAVTANDGAPIVDVQNGPNLKSHHARELRRLRRRISEQGDVIFEVLAGAATRKALEETLEFKRSWLIERGLPSTVLGNGPWEQVILDLAGARCGPSEMMIARLVVGGATAATEIGFVDHDTWFAYMGALAPGSARFGPGHILMDELLSWCRQRGLKSYDLLPPIQPYKLALTAQTIPVRDYAVVLGLAGFPAVSAARAVLTGKKLATAIPLSWRRWMVRRQLNRAAKR